MSTDSILASLHHRGIHIELRGNRYTDVDEHFVATTHHDPLSPGDLVALARHLDEVAFRIALLGTWANLEHKTTAPEFLKMVADAPEKYPDLIASLEYFGQSGKLMSPRALGKRLAFLAGKPVNGLKLLRRNRCHNLTYWEVVRIRSAEPSEIANDIPANMALNERQGRASLSTRTQWDFPGGTPTMRPGSIQGGPEGLGRLDAQRKTNLEDD